MFNIHRQQMGSPALSLLGGRRPDCLLLQGQTTLFSDAQCILFYKFPLNMPSSASFQHLTLKIKEKAGNNLISHTGLKNQKGKFLV